METNPSGEEPNEDLHARELSLAWIWGTTLTLVAVLVGVLDPAAGIEQLAENSGVSAENVSISTQVAILTLPLALAVFALTLAALRGQFDGVEDSNKIGIVGVVLFGSTLLSAWMESSIGSIPLEEFPAAPAGHPLVVLVLCPIVLYASSYGLALFASAVALAVASAITMDRVMGK